MCEFCDCGEKRIKNGFTYGNAYIEKTILATHIHFAMTIALMNTEKEHLRLTIALSVGESWWKDETIRRNIF